MLGNAFTLTKQILFDFEGLLAVIVSRLMPSETGKSRKETKNRIKQIWSLFFSQVRKKSRTCFVLCLLNYIQLVHQGFDTETPRVKFKFFCRPVSKKLMVLREKGMNKIKKGAGKNNWIEKKKFI